MNSGSSDRRGGLAIFGGVGVALACLPERVMAQGCAMCRTALGGPEDPLAAGLNASILFLMSMPFVLVASVGVWLAYMFRRVHQRPTNVYVLPTQQEEGQS
jgi:hypothetical protein